MTTLHCYAAMLAVLIAAASVRAQDPLVLARCPSGSNGFWDVYGEGGGIYRDWVYVVHLSAELRDVRHFVMQAVCEEIAGSSRRHKFNVVWDGFGGPDAVFPTLVPRTAANVELAINRVRSLHFASAGDPLAAMELAYAMGAQGVRLYTDGRFRDDVARQIKEMRPRGVQFGVRGFCFPNTLGRERIRRASDGLQPIVDAAHLKQLQAEGPAIRPFDRPDGPVDLGSYAGLRGIEFVFDRSRTMAAVGNLSALSVSQLLGTMDDDSHFGLIAANEGEYLTFRGGGTRFTKGDSSRLADCLRDRVYGSRFDLRLALEQAELVRVNGEFKERPPDRICILTATDIEPAWVETITAGNKHKIPLDVIAFVLPGSKGHPNLKKLCEANGGRFRAVEPPKAK